MNIYLFDSMFMEFCRIVASPKIHVRKNFSDFQVNRNPCFLSRSCRDLQIVVGIEILVDGEFGSIVRGD